MEAHWKSLILLLVFRLIVGTDQGNNFTLNLFKEVYNLESDRNFVLSPPIIRATLLFLYLTANWNAALEIQQALQLPPDKSEAIVELKNYLVKSIDDRAQLPVSSQIYRDPSELSDILLELLDGYIKPEVSLLSYNDDPSAVISVLLKSTYMPNYNLLISTAFNFSATWRNPFNPQSVRSGMFKFSNGYHQVSFMKKTARFGILKLEQLTALEMLYNSDLSMILVLPNDEDVPLSSLVKDFNLKTYRTIDSRLRQRFVEVAIPRFVVDSSVPLGMSLARMGMVSSFLANAFDFYRYRGSGLGPMDHVGSIRVLEGGTVEVEEALEDTVPPALLPSFRADRPFLFLVRNTTSKDILVIGHHSNFNG
ncbi:AAEL017249-PA [Aedes aegypti]|uniref:AAEL017249-PA n=1 Tax=Aedes aegypti TaxID=7159 RepID=J9HT18_AEDAE|nr:AAEL017249-PA [Aedes aegypti]